MPISPDLAIVVLTTTTTDDRSEDRWTKPIALPLTHAHGVTTTMTTTTITDGQTDYFTPFAE